MSWRNDQTLPGGLQTPTSADGETAPFSDPSGSRTSRTPSPSTQRNGQASTNTGVALPTHDDIVKDMDERLEAIRFAAQPSKPDHGAASSTSADSTDGLPTRGMESLEDPFTGQSIGYLGPIHCDKSQDALWSHLKRIRELQTEIASMHAHMEGLGGTERRPRRRETTGDDEPINIEEEAKAAKAEEFSKLADKFKGRKDAIDAVMSKLEVLSHTINDFHSTRAPTLLFDSLSQEQASSENARNDSAPSASQKPRVLTDDDFIRDSPQSLARNL